ncbi:MAG: hypothetical protein ACR2FE_02330 [Aeromicrobium sp.]
MLEPPPDPGPYPPDRIWRFPPSPISRLWLVAAILGGLLGILALGGATAYLALNATRDLPGLIDDRDVVEVAVRECRLMTSTIEGLPVDGSPSDRLDSLEDQNAAIEHMVDRIRSVGPKTRASDQPLDAWLADWEALVSGRADYIGLQRRGADADFRMPRSPDGEPINERMDLAGGEACPVPKTLLRPDLAGAQPV